MNDRFNLKPPFTQGSLFFSRFPFIKNKVSTNCLIWFVETFLIRRILFICKGLDYPKKYHSDCIDREVCEKVDHPGGVDIAEFFVEIIKDQPADEEPEHHKSEKYGREPTYHHCYVIDRECRRAEDISEYSRG